MLILNRLLDGYNALNSYTDPRTRHYFLYGSPVKILTLVAFYWMFVMKWGPKYMEKRQPFNLDRIIQVYNILQIAANTYIFLKIFHFIITYDINYKCQPTDNSMSPQGMAEVHYFYCYYLLKVVDLVETIFFVLRKKNSQVTFLHVYHHILMVLFVYVVATSTPGGQGSSLPFLNSFVHVVMYCYYFLTSYKPELRNNIWWKKHLTQLQLFQFLLLFIQGSLPLLIEKCDYSSPILIFAVSQALIMMVLFGNFYYQAYINGNKKKK